MDITQFNEKLNKVDGNTYVIEEVVNLVDGAYESELIHDNVNIATLSIYTGSKLTGDKINTYATSTPSLTPWKTAINIYSNVTPLYISYETTGDTVEADDINKLQDAVVATQENLNSEIDRAKNTESTLTDVINNNKPIWDDKYTKVETDNKISQVVSNLDWKESVTTYADLANTYPTPDDGWTVNVKDTDYTYRYDGGAWIPISANSIPLATSTVDGKMSKQDKIDHDDMNSKKHTHANKSIIDAITQALLDAWNSAYTHISDSVKHITSAERALWNTVSNKSDSSHTHDDRYYTEAESDAKYATKDQISVAGYGDMMKSVYDTNNVGIVDNADKLDGKHASDFASSTHNHDSSYMKKGPVTWNDIEGV